MRVTVSRVNGVPRARSACPQAWAKTVCPRRCIVTDSPASRPSSTRRSIQGRIRASLSGQTPTARGSVSVVALIRLSPSPLARGQPRPERQRPPEEGLRRQGRRGERRGGLSLRWRDRIGSRGVRRADRCPVAVRRAAVPARRTPTTAASSHRRRSGEPEAMPMRDRPRRPGPAWRGARSLQRREAKNRVSWTVTPRDRPRWDDDGEGWIEPNGSTCRCQHQSWVAVNRS